MDKIEIPTQIFMEKVQIPRNCMLCDKIFLGKDNWNKHQIEYHVSGNFETCNTCYRRFSKKRSLNTHIREAHNDLQIKAKCDICDKVLDNRNKLKIHNNLNHVEKSFKCTICADAFTYKKLLELHVGRKHLRSRDFPCKECPKKFFCENDVKTHVVQVHSDEKPFSCDICFERFKRNSTWNSHRKTHFDTKDFECPICHKKFKSRASVTNCVYKHDNPERGYHCTVGNCETVLTTAEGLKGHIKTHDKARPRIPCTMCSSTLSSNHELKRHVQQVHGFQKTKFQCDICEVRKFSIAALAVHKKIHNGDIFPCNVEGCNSKSNTKYGANFHFKKYHGQINHRRPIEEIKKDQDRMLECTICGRKIRAGASPLHMMKLHMKIHETKIQHNCPLKKCPKRFGASSNSYSLPV